MNKTLLIMTTLAITLFTICYEFPSHSHETSLLTVFLSIYSSTSIIFYSFIVCSALIVLDYFKDLVQELFTQPKLYAQRISKQEYESQKSTYTQMKLNELLNSQAYKDYLKSRESTN